MRKIIFLVGLLIAGCANSPNKTISYDDKDYLDQEIFTLEQIKHADFGAPLVFDDLGMCSDSICNEISPNFLVKFKSKGHIFLNDYKVNSDYSLIPTTGPHKKFVFGYFIESRNGETWFVHKRAGLPSLVCNNKKECDLR